MGRLEEEEGERRRRRRHRALLPSTLLRYFHRSESTIVFVLGRLLIRSVARSGGGLSANFTAKN